MQAVLKKPSDQAQLQELVQNAYNVDNAIFCGGGNGGADNALPVFSGRNNIHVDISDLKNIREHVLSDMVLGVETGILMTELAAVLAEHGQIFPVHIQDEGLRLIDVIATGDGGYLEQGYGYLRSQILGLELIYENGKKANFGGRVVKNVTGFDLTKLIVGGRGVFGIPSFAFLRLFARPEAIQRLLVDKRSAADLMFLAGKLLASGLPLSALELLESESGAASGYNYALFVEIRGTKSLVGEVSASVRDLIGEMPVIDISGETLFKTYPALVSSQKFGLEIALSRASASALIDHLAGFGSRGLLRYRQSMARLYVDCPDEKTLAHVGQLIDQFLSSTTVKTGGNALAEYDQATSAKIAGPFIFESLCRRENDAPVADLIGRLRHTLDPAGCFGRGVKFHGR